MTSRIEQGQSDDFLTTRDAWIEGRAPILGDPLLIFGMTINNLFLGGEPSTIPGHERGRIQPVTTLDKPSGKAVEIKNAPIKQCVRIHQALRVVENLISLYSRFNRGHGQSVSS